MADSAMRSLLMILTEPTLATTIAKTTGVVCFRHLQKVMSREQTRVVLLLSFIHSLVCISGLPHARAPCRSQVHPGCLKRVIETDAAILCSGNKLMGGKDVLSREQLLMAARDGLLSASMVADRMPVMIDLLRDFRGATFSCFSLI